jgi:branched-chain amino acid transport system permease protein
MVLALQVFIGNSGVLSFGQSAFAMLGGMASGLATAPVLIKENLLSDLWEPLRVLQMGTWPSLLLAVVVGMFAAFVTGIFLMRLNGLAAGIATFALLMVADNLFFNWKLIGPGPQVLPKVPKFDRIEEALALALVAMVVVYLMGISRRGRLLRATREDGLAARALGTGVWRLRVLFFTTSGAVAALSGAMYVHHAGAVSARDFYLGFTFTTLAMLVIGGVGSVWGAVVGTLAVAAIGEVLLQLEQGVELGGLSLSIPDGARGVVIAAALILMLIWRPRGVTGGREFRLPSLKGSRG